MLFKNIDINAKKKLDAYFDMVDYEACEYCFTTLYMWQHAYKTGYYIGDDFAIIVGEYEGDSFSILPLAYKDKLDEVIDFVLNCFENKNKKVYFRGITKEVVDILKEKYPSRFEYIQERDLFDYIYEAEGLRTLAGRKNQKKRNHINSFLKEYEGRYKYTLLNKENFDECLEIVKDWTNNKEEQNDFNEGMDDEFLAINKIFNDYDELKDKIKIAGIYIDEKLEAFTIGEYLNKNMALIHIEKANPDIRGLYPFINQQFLQNEFSDVDFVNREEDLGIEGLRKAKLSYHPCKFVEKYTIREV
ncbi:DUF2156 domain-containing protein [Romboutsia maritimum]|uniref:DUF2156 domain-containing protein n=1 Tax=Romboutsia maritimum TaxID=2020948 RepID=A0A371IU29_9FIRM|nr:phosphatidylglycerol lysyltransferase domain-containing protein [Romboutsia maritimum]RDY23990.1 DUF2156 domain-containing protein [Romboutsia maritimum]